MVRMIIVQGDVVRSIVEVDRGYDWCRGRGLVRHAYVQGSLIFLTNMRYACVVGDEWEQRDGRTAMRLVVCLSIQHYPG